MAREPRVRHLTLGDVASIRLVGDSVKLPEHAGGFDCPPASSCTTLTLEVRGHPAPSVPGLDPVLDSGSLWRVSRSPDAWVIDVPRARIVVDLDLDEGTIHPDGEMRIEYPLDELLFSAILTRRRAVILHACAVAHEGRGLLMCGPSGAGKSTMASLLSERDGVTVMSDDRVVLSLSGPDPRVTGTPWHGTTGHGTNVTATVEHVHFLGHGRTNRFTPLSSEEAAVHLATMAVIPFWSRSCSQEALDVVVEASRRIPASRLEFIPDPSAVTTLL